MGESTCTLTLLDVADVLQAKYAFISGGRSRGGSPIITFPDNPGEAELGEEQYRQVVNYLTSIPTLQEVDLGFALIVDRRQCGWGAVKTMLLRISGFFPGLVQEVFVLRPSGFLQRTFTDMGFKFVRDEFKFKVLMCSTVEELQQHIEPNQLTVDLGGSLVYNHDEWIQQRAAIEKFSSNTTQIGQNLRSLCQRLQETEFPNDVSATEALKETHNDERQLVRDDLHMTISHGELLLNCFKVVRDEEGKEKELTSAELPSCKLAHVTAIERLLVQLEETEHNFDEFWFHHEQRLQQCLQLRKFEEDFKQVQFTIDRHLMTLDSMSSDSGDSLQRVESLLRELADFEEESKDDFSKGEELHETGEKLIEDDHYAVDCIRPKCIELQRMCEQYRELVRRRYDVLNKSRELQDRIDKANKWCTAGVDLLAGQQLEKCNTPEGAETALKELETYLETANDLKLNNPREFKTMFDNMITPETRSVVQNVLQRIEDVQSMCDKRRQSLKRLVQKLHRPVQPVVPEPAVPIVQQAPPPSSPAPHSPGTVTTEGERRRKKSLSGGGKRNGSIDRGNKTRVEIIRNDGSGSDTSGSVDMDSDQSNNKIEVPTVDMATLPRKRGHVMRELIETERFYVKELNEVLEGYMREMDSAYMQDLVPEELRGKQDILFGNLPQIYDFHANVFLKDLENCRSTPGMVGKCFVSRKEEFQMYSTYCQNKLASEALQQEVGDNNAFFKECQEKLKHRLPLGAYLLKPVQRITKYQLLIKEMLKFTNSDQGTQELQEAVNTMLSVVKYVNDIMHQVAITGYPGELSELGKLLMQGSFNVWMEDKKTKIKDIRFKPMQRHVFLYEKRFLFCKKKDDAQSAEKASYIFKTELQTADVGLTENVKGDKKKFEVWRPGRARVYTCQAPTVEIKDAWTDAMKQLLMSQFDQLKGKVKKEIPTIPLPPSVPTIQLGPIPKHSESATFQSVHNIENTANNNHTVVSEEPSQGLTSPLDDLIKQEESQGTNSTLEDRDNNQANVPQNMDDYDEEHEPEQDQEHVYSSDEYEEENSAQDSSFNSDSHGMEFTGFIALADYPPIDSSELGLHEGDLVTVIKVGSSGWWYVRNLSTGDEGWAPASYLDTAKRLSSHSTLSMSSTESGGMFGGMRNTVSRSSMNSGMSSGSQVETAEETLV